MADRYDLSRVSRETLEAFALTTLRLADHCDGGTLMPDGLIEQRIRQQMAIRDQARIPLRTRAEVDTEINTTVRSWFSNAGGRPVGMADSTVIALARSCAEPTAEPAPCPHGCTEDGHPNCPTHGSAPLPAKPSATQHSGLGSADAFPSASPAGVETTYHCPTDCECRAVPSSDDLPDRCSCDEALELRDAVNEAAKLLNAIHEAAKSIVELSRRVP